MCVGRVLAIRPILAALDLLNFGVNLFGLRSLEDDVFVLQSDIDIAFWRLALLLRRAGFADDLLRFRLEPLRL
jgi:hypothetical protein